MWIRFKVNKCPASSEMHHLLFTISWKCQSGDHKSFFLWSVIGYSYDLVFHITSALYITLETRQVTNTPSKPKLTSLRRHNQSYHILKPNKQAEYDKTTQNAHKGYNIRFHFASLIEKTIYITRNHKRKVNTVCKYYMVLTEGMLIHLNLPRCYRQSYGFICSRNDG